MLTAEEIQDIVNTLLDRQADRLVKSTLGVNAFLAEPYEKAVTFEVECYGHLLAQMEKPLPLR